MSATALPPLALADADTCDNSSCPNGPDAPARYSIVVEAFDDSEEEFYDRTYHACAACNHSCKKSFLGNRIKSHVFDNSIRDKASASPKTISRRSDSSVKVSVSGTAQTTDSIPTTAPSFPTDPALNSDANLNPPKTAPALNIIADPSDGSTPTAATTLLQVALRTLNARPPTPAAFVATIRVRHDALGAGTDTPSSPEPDIWTPSPHSSPDEIDDLTARAALPLPASHSGSDASRAPSRASSVDEPVNVAAMPLPTPDYSAIADDDVHGLIHPSFPDRAILDDKDKRHFLGRGDLSVTSLKLYARRIFTDASHWITVGHFLVDIFEVITLPPPL
ncbi:hypothetical protein AX14_001305 [Amanita brunnescens Koide BX004]|nr:hypothetical protein AX14_001305 [Amanita brunnescens Koide BX004]